ncbi:hypothetical protein QIG13_27765, partial [Klebsiella pneumoniae]|nr:hypothetical protein [Klebsiella pneumoniae]
LLHLTGILRHFGGQLFNTLFAGSDSLRVLLNLAGQLFHMSFYLPCLFGMLPGFLCTSGCRFGMLFCLSHQRLKTGYHIR